VKNTKVIVTLVLCVTLVLLSSIAAFVYVNISNQNRLSAQSEQVRKDKIFSECMERTKTETVGLFDPKTMINKDGDEGYCRKQMEKQ